MRSSNYTRTSYLMALFAERYTSVHRKTRGLYLRPEGRSFTPQLGNFQTLVLGAFNFSDAYDVQSEVEVRGEDKGFVDILAVPKAGSSVTTAYLVELKHLKAKEYSAAAVDRLVREAQDQMARYVEGANLKTIQNLKTVTAVFVGMKLEKLVVR